MSKKKSGKNQYTQEFKEQVLEVLEHSPKTIHQIAEKFGIAYTTLHGWKTVKEKKSNFSPKQDCDETKKLIQENERLRKENEILKKAATFFAKQLD